MPSIGIPSRPCGSSVGSSVFGSSVGLSSFGLGSSVGVNLAGFVGVIFSVFGFGRDLSVGLSFGTAIDYFGIFGTAGTTFGGVTGCAIIGLAAGIGCFPIGIGEGLGPGVGICGLDHVSGPGIYSLCPGPGI